MANDKVIKMCEELLSRARSGETLGLLISELRQNNMINASFQFDDEKELHKAATFSSAAIWADQLREPKEG